MGKKRKVSREMCATCKYHMQFGSNSNQETRTNVACNYLQIKNTSRIFEDGKLRIDPEYCDKYEKGKKINYEFAITHKEQDEYELYKSRRIRLEMKGQFLMPEIRIKWDKWTEIVEKMCDDYCIWPTECPTQERLNKYCEECPLNNIDYYPLGRNDWQE